MEEEDESENEQVPNTEHVDEDIVF